MSLYKLSPNEEVRVIKEESQKRRIIRIQQVRKQAKNQSASILKNVDEKKKHLQQIALSKLKREWHSEHTEEILKAEENLKNTLTEIGESHRNASEFDVDIVAELKALRDAENQSLALKRQGEALKLLRNEKETIQSKDLQHLFSKFSALDMEKARAAMVASMPRPKPKPELHIEPQKPKSFLRTATRSNVVVEKENIDSNFATMTAHERADLSEQKYESMEERKKRIISERRLETLSRHKDALSKERQVKEQQSLIHDLQDHRNEGIAAKKSEVEKTSKQLLMSNLKQKAEKEILFKQQPHTPRVETNATVKVRAEGRAESSCDKTSELVCFSPPPSENLSSFDAMSGSTPTEAINEVGGQVDDETETNQLLELDGTTSNDRVHKVFHLEENERMRLVQLIERQKLSLLTSQGGQSMKKDVSLQTNIEISKIAPKMKHEAIQATPDESDIGLNDFGYLTNSYIASHHSFEEQPTEPNLFMGNNNELSSLEKIREEELMNDKVSRLVQSSSDNQMVDDMQPIRNFKTFAIPHEYHHQHNDESMLSSCSSTKYLGLPSSDASTIEADNISELNRPINLSGTTVEQGKKAEKDSSNPEPLVHSQNMSTNTEYLGIPSPKHLPLESKLNSPSRNVLSILQRPTINLVGSHDQQNTQIISKCLLMGGGDENFVSKNLPRPPACLSRNSSDLSNNCNHFHDPSDQNVNCGIKLLDLNNFMQMFKNETAIDIMSERASIISVQLGNLGSECSRLSMGGKSETSNNFRRVSKIFKPITSNSESAETSLASSYSDHKFPDILWNTLNSTLDINSERASMISVEILDPKDEICSSEYSNAEDSRLKVLKYFQSQSSICQEQLDSTCGESTMEEDSIRSNTSKRMLKLTDNDRSHSGCHTTRDWLKILEPYKSKMNINKQGTISNEMMTQDQIAERGILEEPDLTLVSANTTMLSVAADSLQNSGLQSSSLLSFETHEKEICNQNAESSINLPCLRLEDKIRKSPEKFIRDTKKKKKSDQQINHLMYPDKKERNQSLKETLESWTKSRTSHSTNTQSKDRKSNNPKKASTSKVQ